VVLLLISLPNLPFFHSVVLQRIDDDESTEYINANFIPGFDGVKGGGILAWPLFALFSLYSPPSRPTYRKATFMWLHKGH